MRYFILLAILFSVTLSDIYAQGGDNRTRRRKRDKDERREAEAQKETEKEKAVQTAVAQNGTLKILVIDKTTAETLIGANVRLNELNKGGVTDLDGNVVFSDVPPGKYSITIEYVSYNKATITEIVPRGGEVLDISAALVSEDIELDAVVVEQTYIQTSNAAQLSMQRNAIQISDGFSGSMVLKETPDFNVSTVLRRMPGVALLEEKHLVIRGAAERYNMFLLNTSILPVTDLERASFDFGKIPSNMLTSIRILKSATADMPAEFGGGFIQFNTTDIPDKSNFRVYYQLGFNSLSTFQDFKSYEMNKPFLGVFKRLEVVPDDFPAAKDLIGTPLTSQTRYAAARKLNNKTKAREYTAIPNQNFGLVYQKRDTLFGNDAGYSVFVNLNESYMRTEQNNAIVLNYDEKLGKNPVSERLSVNNFYKKQVLTGILDLGYALGKKGKISWDHMYGMSSENHAGDQNATLSNPNLEGQVIEYYYNPQRFILRQLYNTDLNVSYAIPVGFLKDEIKVEGRVNYTHLDTDDPAYRAVAYVKDPVTGRYTYNSAGFYTRMLMAMQDDNVVGYNAKVEIPLKFIKKFDVKLTTGVFTNIRNKTYRSRLFSYDFAVTSDAQSIDNLSPETKDLDNIENIYSPANIGPGGFTLYEATDNFDNYDAKGHNNAFFGMIDILAFNHLRLNAGLRADEYVQTIDILPADQAINPKSRLINTVKRDILPSFNASYSITDKVNVRAAFCETVTRPIDRELVPLIYFNINNGTRSMGNPTLERTLHRSMDLRLEYFPSGNEVMSATIFFKKMENPIEQKIVESKIGGAQLFQLTNGEIINEDGTVSKRNAVVGGLELEFRRNIGNIIAYDKLRNYTFYTNLTLLRSRIVAQDSSGVMNLFDEGRQLQGQASYTLNMGLIYNDIETGWNAAIFYNRVGQRIAVVGTSPTVFASIWERPRDVIDLQVGKTIKERWELRLSVADLLHQDLQWVQIYDNRTKYDESKDALIRTTKFGLNAYFTVSYKF